MEFDSVGGAQQRDIRWGITRSTNAKVCGLTFLSFFLSFLTAHDDGGADTEPWATNRLVYTTNGWLCFSHILRKHPYCFKKWYLPKNQLIISPLLASPSVSQRVIRNTACHSWLSLSWFGYLYFELAVFLSYLIHTWNHISFCLPFVLCYCLLCLSEQPNQGGVWSNH